jgi:hypothetical protein
VGFRGAWGSVEGPVKWKEGGSLLFSDLQNNRRMTYRHLGKACPWSTITTGQEAYQNHRLRNRPGPVLGAAPPIGSLNGLRPRENNTDQT